MPKLLSLTPEAIAVSEAETKHAIGILAVVAYDAAKSRAPQPQNLRERIRARRAGVTITAPDGGVPVASLPGVHVVSARGHRFGGWSAVTLNFERVDGQSAGRVPATLMLNANYAMIVNGDPTEKLSFENRAALDLAVLACEGLAGVGLLQPERRRRNAEYFVAQAKAFGEQLPAAQQTTYAMLFGLEAPAPQSATPDGFLPAMASC